MKRLVKSNYNNYLELLIGIYLMKDRYNYYSLDETALGLTLNNNEKDFIIDKLKDIINTLDLKKEYDIENISYGFNAAGLVLTLKRNKDFEDELIKEIIHFIRKNIENKFICNLNKDNKKYKAFVCCGEKSIIQI